MDLKMSDIWIWYATPDEFAAAGTEHKFSVAVFDPFTYFEITDLFGYKADTLAKKMLVLVFCNAGQSLSMWLIKIFLMALAGCNSAAFTAGISGAAALSVFGFVFLRKIFRKR